MENPLSATAVKRSNIATAIASSFPRSHSYGHCDSCVDHCYTCVCHDVCVCVVCVLRVRVRVYGSIHDACWHSVVACWGGHGHCMYCEHVFICRCLPELLWLHIRPLIGRGSFCSTLSLALFNSAPSLAGTQQQHLHLHQRECGSAAAAPTAGMHRVQ